MNRRNSTSDRVDNVVSAGFPELRSDTSKPHFELFSGQSFHLFFREAEFVAGLGNGGGPHARIETLLDARNGVVDLAEFQTRSDERERERGASERERERVARERE